MRKKTVVCTKMHMNSLRLLYPMHCTVMKTNGHSVNLAQILCENIIALLSLCGSPAQLY